MCCVFGARVLLADPLVFAVLGGVQEQGFRKDFIGRWQYWRGCSRRTIQRRYKYRFKHAAIVLPQMRHSLEYVYRLPLRGMVGLRSWVIFCLLRWRGGAKTIGGIGVQFNWKCFHWQRRERPVGCQWVLIVNTHSQTREASLASRGEWCLRGGVQ